MNHWTPLLDPASALPARAPVVAHPQTRWQEPPVSTPAKKKPTMREHLAQRWATSFRRRLLVALMKGSMDRDAFLEIAHGMYEGDSETAVAGAVKTLLRDGLIRCEISLTPAGMEKLGIQGLE